MGWLNYDVKLWTRIRDAARDLVRAKLAHPIVGYDLRHDAIAFAEGNAKSAGIGNLLTFARADIRAFAAPAGPPASSSATRPTANDSAKATIGRSLPRARRRHSPRVRLARLHLRQPRRADAGHGHQAKKRTSLFNGKIHCELMEFPADVR